jgi:phosphoenolpyruvate synthase/pyruvate phosphate dikinase
VKIEEHYGKPMDIERAVENDDIVESDDICILQARPITTFGEKTEYLEVKI